MGNLLAFAALGMALFNLAVLLIALDNSKVIPTLVSASFSGGIGDPPVSPLASILVPARNEARVIAPCLISLANQDYPDFEILVLDDHSTDQTRDITEKLSRAFPAIRLIPSETLPEGWLGKNWACHQLGQAARGDLLLFTDADTFHQPGSLSGGIRLIQSSGVGMVSAIPQEQVETWAER